VFIFTILIQKTLVTLANYVRKGSLRHQYREVMRLNLCRHGLNIVPVVALHNGPSPAASDNQARLI
jgi:hypothetical protein